MVAFENEVSNPLAEEESVGTSAAAFETEDGAAVRSEATFESEGQKGSSGKK